jgi:hypothetical protein
VARSQEKRSGKERGVIAVYALPLALLLLQAPGDGWALVQAPAREVRTLYWDLFQTTEVWLTVLPQEPERRVRLVFQAFFAGREVKGPPRSVVVRALFWSQPPAEAFTLIEPSLRFVIDGNAVDLTGPGGCSMFAAPDASCFPLYPCVGCSANGVGIKLEPPLLQALASGKIVQGKALGFPFVLSVADHSALAQFVDQVGVKGKKGQ